MQPRYQIAITLTKKELDTLKELRKHKWSNIDIFRYGLKGITNMIQKAKDIVKS